MSKVHRKEFVTFYSPGTLFSESTSKPIGERDTRLAVQMADAILERHGAKPYAFKFETRLVADDVPDGLGGSLKVESKLVEESGFHFLGGKLETLDDVEKRDDPKESILRSNMRCNDNLIVCVNTNSYRSTMPFDEADCIVDATGQIVEKGNDPKHVGYRDATRARLKAER